MEFNAHSFLQRELDRRIPVAVHAAQLACQRSLEFQKQMGKISTKPDQSWISEADLKIEKELRTLLQAKFPQDAILGEEDGLSSEIGDGTEDFKWILDPIDGTFSFINQVPFYSNLIALLYKGQPVLGMANLPRLGIQMFAVKSRGVKINGKPYLAPSLSSDILATADPYRFHQTGNSKLIEQFYGANSLFKARTYPDALGYYLLLQGSIFAFVDPKVEVWDVAPFHVIMPEAGFQIGPWAGTSELKRGNSICTRKLGPGSASAMLVDILVGHDQR